MVNFCVCACAWLQKTSVQWQTREKKKKKKQKRLTLSSCKRPTHSEAISTFALPAAHLTPCHTIGCWPRGGGHLKSQWYQNESFVTFSTFKSVKIHFHQIRSTRSEFFIQSNPSRMRMAASKITHFPNKTVYEKVLCLNWQFSQNSRRKVPGWLPVRFRSVHLIDNPMKTWERICEGQWSNAADAGRSHDNNKMVNVTFSHCIHTTLNILLNIFLLL